jgi:hypothetical protein
VFDAFDVRDHLKDLGYRWNGAQKYWHRAVLAEGFSFDVLLGQSWAREASEWESTLRRGSACTRNEWLAGQLWPNQSLKRPRKK